MASIGHIAVGMAAARVYRGRAAPQWSSMAWWSALSLLPDADVIGFALGVEYADPWGHRGATHSLTFAMAIATALGLAAPRLRLPAWRTLAFAGVVLVSHGLLDTLTDGGLGSALLWPFDLTRYFAPWRPIPVAPIGLDFLSPYGLVVALTELVLFAPLVVFALRLTRHHEVPAACLDVYRSGCSCPATRFASQPSESSFAKTPSMRAASPTDPSRPSGSETRTPTCGG